MSPEDNLKKNNIILPTAANPVGSYVATKISGKLLFISGQISINENGDLIKGQIGKDLNTDDGYKAAARSRLAGDDRRVSRATFRPSNPDRRVRLGEQSAKFW